MSKAARKLLNENFHAATHSSVFNFLLLKSISAHRQKSNSAPWAHRTVKKQTKNTDGEERNAEIQQPDTRIQKKKNLKNFKIIFLRICWRMFKHL